VIYDTTDLSGYVPHTLAPMETSPLGSRLRWVQADDLGVRRPAEDEPTTIYLCADPHAYDAIFPLNTLVAHEALHVLQNAAGYPLEWHEPPAYFAARHWHNILAGFRRLNAEEQSEVQMLLRKPCRESTERALLTLVEAGRKPNRPSVLVRGRTQRHPKPLPGPAPRAQVQYKPLPLTHRQRRAS
jgi:hypothetical protein